MMWHGRERIAQGHYHKAMKSAASGDTEQALWHANMALHNHPRMLPAALLKEKILRQREWNDDLFRSRSDSTAREEIIILLTVHIVKDQAAYADASLAEYHNVDRLRVGARQGRT